MPIFLMGSGLVMILTGVKGNPSALWALLQGDVTGPKNFVYWIVAIFVLGAVGYIPGLQKFARLFMVLVLIGLLVDNKGFFAKLQEFINSTQSMNASSSSIGG